VVPLMFVYDEHVMTLDLVRRLEEAHATAGARMATTRAMARTLKPRFIIQLLINAPAIGL
jgi:hypothetical protein